jgi:Flp pilus assembly protein TadG
MLMPAAVLIVILLGSIAVDFSVVFMAQHDLVSASSAAANDAVTFGVDQATFRSGGGYELDRDRVETAVATALSSRGLCGQVTGTITIEGASVTVDLHRQVKYIFAKAVPGIDHTAEVEGHDRAVAEGAPDVRALSTTFDLSC